MRSFRQRAGIERLEEASALIDVSPVTMGRIEKGEAPISRASLGALANLFGLNGQERDALMELARQTRGKRGAFPAYFTGR